MSPTARVLLRPAAATLAAGLVVLTAGWGSAAGGAPQQVEVVDFGYEPTAVSVAVGETVTWRWTGESPHSVTAPGRFDSHPDCTALTPEACGTAGDTFVWTADEPGTIGYRCRLHPDRMQGVVEVIAAPPSPSPEPPPASPRPDPEPDPQPTPQPEPTPAPPRSSPSPSPSPSRAPVGPPTSPPAQPVPTITPTASPASPTPRPSASPDDPDLEPFPEPVVPSPSASADPLADDVVAVERPATDPAGRLRVVAGVTFGVTLLAFARVVLFGRGWF